MPRRPPGLWFAVALVPALLAVPLTLVHAEVDVSPDRAEPGSIEQIRSYTTSPEYLPESVAYVPDSDRVPSPTKALGHLAGAPNELSSVAQVHDYFRKLAAASGRVRIETIGKSEEGREILLAIVSSEANLAQLDHYRDITNRLADPRRVPEAEMRRLAAEGKPFYYLMGGLHSPETGSPEMLMELAYRLAVSDKPQIQRIRDQVIVLITPVVEVDGRDRQVQWYYRHTRDLKLPFEDLEQFDSPPYWGAYALHDNNRDGMQLTLALTRAINSAYYRYEPQVLHDLHESVPLLYISSGHGPYTHAADAITVNQWTEFAHHEARVVQAQGLPGVWTWGFWDGWWPGYLFSVANNHNGVGRFYETMGNGMAGTFERSLKDDSYAGQPVTDVEWYRPWPPAKKIQWSLRNNTNYMEAGVLAALDHTAVSGRELLADFWVKGQHAIERGKKEKPYAWVLPEAQRDPARLQYLLRQLLVHHIEVQRLRGAWTSGDSTYAAGSYVVRMDQPYRNAALTFLEVQQFPPDEPNAPYDDVAWTWPLLYGVRADVIDDAKVLDAAMDGPITTPPLLAGRVTGAGGTYLVRDTGQTSFLAARVLLGKNVVEAADSAFVTGGASYPAGSWIVHAPRATVDGVAQKTGLEFTAGAPPAATRHHGLDLPRLGVLHTWTATQDCGWARYALDQTGIPYTLIHDGDLKRGGLAKRFDMILFPNTWGDFKRIVHGIDKKYGPLAYTRTAAYPSHGIPDASPDITGGMGFEGLMELQRFVESGGLLVTLANAGTLPVDGGLVTGVSKAAAGLVSSPGSEVRAKILRPTHPITYGYETLESVFRGNGPLFEVADRHRNLVVAQFGTKKVPEEDEAKPAPEPKVLPVGVAESGPRVEGPETAAGAPLSPAKKDAKPADAPKGDIVLSGFVKQKDKLDGMPAILDVPAGKGRVVLFAFNPLHRYLNHSDFRFVYNAVLNWNDLAGR